MNRYFLLLVLLLAAGCNYYQNKLARRPAINDGGAKMYAIEKKIDKKSKKPKNDSDDPAFDLIFGKGQKEEKRAGVVSDADKSFLSGYSQGHASEDPDIKAVKERNKERSNAVKDEVFGTTGGSYF